MEVASGFTLFTLFTQFILEWANEPLSKMLDGVEWILVSEMIFSSLSVRALPVLEMKI